MPTPKMYQLIMSHFSPIGTFEYIAIDKVSLISEVLAAHHVINTIIMPRNRQACIQ